MIFIIPPKKHLVLKVLGQCRGKNLFWVYLGENVRDVVDIESWIGTRGKRVALAQRLQSTARLLRDSYLEYIGKLSLKYHSLLWWANELSEKDPSSSKILRNACYIRIARQLMEEAGSDNVMIIADRHALRRSLMKVSEPEIRDVRWFEPASHWMSKYFIPLVAIIRHGYFLLRTSYLVLVTQLFIRSHRSKNEVTRQFYAQNELSVVYVWVDGRSRFENHLFKDAYLGKIGEFLQLNGEKVVYLPDVLPTVPYVKMLRRLIKGDNIFLFPFAYLKVRDIIAVAFKSLFAGVKVNEYPLFEMMDVSELIEEQCQRFFMKGYLCYPLLRAFMVKRWRESGLQIRRVVYPFENKRWEKVFCHALKEHYPGTVVMGYAHSSISLMALDHFWTKGEIELMPRPDMLITNGEAYVELFRKNGFGADKVFSVGAMRYAYLFNNKPEGPRKARGSNGGRPTILVTASMDRNSAVELILKTIRALGSKKEYNVILKCHPVTPFTKLWPLISKEMMPDNFELSENDVGTLLEDAAVLIYYDSTTSLESICKGVPVIQVSSDLGIDGDPLDLFPEVRHVAYSSDDIARYVDHLIEMDGGKRSELMEASTEKIKRLLKPMTEESVRGLLNVLRCDQGAKA